MEAHKVKGPYEAFVKRGLDILISIFVIVLFWWLYVIIAVLVRINLGGPVIFSQDRPGKIDPRTGKETIFKLYKFRSMNDKRDANGELLPGAERLTSFGSKLRSTSLDELPEIVNILKGDMSWIGPRPLATIYLPYYTDEERIRHAVRPGLTGLAQASGRNNLTWEEKFSYDVEYSRNITFLMDMKIILKTIKAVLFHEGIGQGEQTPESFHVYRQRQIEERAR
jgi:lipopolysaccharide/colanic/teichoic acid biosynthesis glycosyltransferase